MTDVKISTKTWTEEELRENVGQVCSFEFVILRVQGLHFNAFFFIVNASFSDHMLAHPELALKKTCC